MTADRHPPRISVVLPVYRNRPHLAELYRRLTDVLGPDTGGHELVFVDDCGGDGSVEWLRECRARDDRVIVVETAQNAGQHRAVLAGLARTSGAIVAVMDADLQDRPEDLPRLIQALGAHEGVVFARRIARHQSAGRHFTGRLFKRLLRRIAASRIPVGTGMFFVASRPVVDAAVQQSSGSRYVPLLLDQTGATLTAVDVSKELRRDNPSSYSAGRRLTLALGALRQALEWRRRRRHRPQPAPRVTNPPE